MIQKEFAQRVVDMVRNDEDVLGLAAAGSWITNEMDAFSDLDLILVTKEKIGGDRARMLDYASRFGDLLSGFTGEHVGEPRVLICLYNNPLLHVDIKFVTPEEFGVRVETPVILLDKNNRLKQVLEQTKPCFPYPDYQWIEDRFWIWTHYALQKIERGELLEAFDFLGYLRLVVFGPLLHVKNHHLPRGVRKVEQQLPATDLEALLATLPAYSKTALLESLQKAVALYRELRRELYPASLTLQAKTEAAVMDYFGALMPVEE